MSPKTYLRILQGGIALSLMAILFVFKELLFPYITSKQLPFNIIMEFLFVIWLVFIMRYPKYRPKKNLITYGLVVYFLAILASCVVSVDFNLSFWGDAERMLGFFHLVHFLIFYLIIITAFRSWKDWQNFFGFSIAIAVLVSLTGLLGKNPYGTIGNTAYVSGYLIFNLYFVVLLFFRSNNKKSRWFLLLPFLIMLFEFWKMKTSGAIIGLGASFLLLFLLLGLTHVNKKIRRLSLFLFLGAGIALIFIFSQSQSAWFQNSFLRNLTPQKATFQTRLISWRGGLKDFKEHPVFGNGFGNYAVIFDKHFDSKFYDYTVGDTYFDRAHNNIIDIVSTTGLVGLLTYLSIFIAAFYYLFKEFKINGKRSGSDANGLNNLEIIVIASLISAYFIQNLAIFDSFSTFLGLMGVLGFIYWLNFRRLNQGEEKESYRMEITDRKSEIWILVILLFIAYVFTNHYNFKALKMMKGTIDSYAKVVSGRVLEGIAQYNEVLEDGPMERDSRATLSKLIISDSSILSNMNAKEAEETLEYAISLAEKNLAYNPLDSMMQLQLAQILNTAAGYYYQDLDKFNNYSTRAMQAIERSIEASPGRATVYFYKAQIQITRNEYDEAIETMRYAISLNPNFAESHCTLTQFLFVINKEGKYDDVMEESFDNCFAKTKEKGSSVSDVILKMGANHYSLKKEYAKAAEISEYLAETSEPTAEIWNNIARLYFVSGKEKEAEIAFAKASSLDPSLIDSWNSFKVYVKENPEEFK